MSKQRVITNNKFSTALVLMMAVVAAALFAGSLKLPLWHLKMESPQYQGSEALRVQVFPGHMQGDLREIRVLNQYIGVHIPEQLPELRWLPVALLAGGALGLLAVLLPPKQRSRALLVIAALLSATLLVSAGLAQWQMHQIGHARDAHTILRGVQDFTPPLLGRVKIANFEITTTPGSGAVLIAAGLLLQAGIGLAGLKVRVKRPAGKAASAQRACASMSVPSRALEFSI